MIYIFQFLLTAFLIFAVATYGNIEGIILENGYVSALIFSVVLALMNLIFGTALRIITLPIRFLTLGLFSLVISGTLVYVTDQLVPGVILQGALPIFLIALISGVTSMVMRIFK